MVLVIQCTAYALRHVVNCQVWAMIWAACDMSNRLFSGKAIVEDFQALQYIPTYETSETNLFIERWYK